jgi:ketosteroid isomerase-like protein
MSQQNVEIVRGAMDAWNGGGGVDALLAFIHPDAVTYPFPEWPEDRVYRGHEGARRLAGVWTQPFDEYAGEMQEIRDLGDQVVWLGWTTGRIKGAGTPIRQPLGAVFSRFRGGMIGEGRFFLTWDEALDAARWSE